ncbi:MAG TPA: carboxymuconolactone decarboxylase family protein [Solirubrobacteraceae bacterium]|nr:carboxymuconolactone decarboxylase family protein [Solirubrobacteraceae bacterium]
MPELKTQSIRMPDYTPNPDSVAGIQQIVRAIYAGGVPRKTLDLVHMRASQINGCNGCIAYGMQNAAAAGISTEQLLSLPAWRESALFSDSERAALAMTEAMTRLADHPDSVSDEIWAGAAEHFDNTALVALASMAALTNFFNRVNTTLRVQVTF